MTPKLFPMLHVAGIAVFSIALSSCTVTETVKDILSSTTPGDWYTEDGLPKAEYKVKCSWRSIWRISKQISLEAKGSILRH